MPLTIIRDRWRVLEGNGHPCNYTKEETMEDWVNYLKRQNRHATVEKKINGLWIKQYSF